MLRRYLTVCLLLAGPAGACSIEQRAQVPLTRSAGLLLAPVRLNGAAIDLLLDTGAERSVLGEAAVRALGLPLDPWVSTGMQGVGGIERHRNADVASFTIGGAPLRRRALAGVASMPVAPSLAQAFGRDVAGLLGMDLLSVYDLEIDPAAPSLTLHAVQGCAGRFPPWSTRYTQVAASLPRVGVMIVPVQVNGAALRALVDTGSTTTLLDDRAARHLRVTAGQAGSARGIGPGTLALSRVTLAELRIGEAAWPHPVVAVARLPGLGYDMVLGMDVLGGRKLWLSFEAAQLFIGGAGEGGAGE